MSGRTCPRKDPRLLLCDETLNKLEGTISMLASIIATAAVTIITIITELRSWLYKWMEGFIVINDGM